MCRPAHRRNNDPPLARPGMNEQRPLSSGPYQTSPATAYGFSRRRFGSP